MFLEAAAGEFRIDVIYPASFWKGNGIFHVGNAWVNENIFTRFVTDLVRHCAFMHA